MNTEKPELLMPAGSLQKMEYAYAYGADAVYLGVPLFSLRARENDFDLEQLYKARELSQKLHKKMYVTANVFAKNRKIESFKKHLDTWMAVKPDALIMGDPGLMMMAREKFPDANIHLSVQANCMNWQTVKFWHKSLNISRIILSRELHVDEIKEIKDHVPEIELEAFVHGSICIAYSGRCLMSSYMSLRDANQGVCDNSCREKFNVFSTGAKQKDEDYFVEDLREKGSLYQIDEDENGTYIMNAKDLRLIQYLKEITDAGVCSFKVEGRTKSLNYVALVAKAYRKAIDDMWVGKNFNPELLRDLDKVANRGYDTGFMIRKNPSAESQNYQTGVSRHYSQKFGGLVVDPSTQIKTGSEVSGDFSAKDIPPGFIAIEVRNKIVRGQTCEILIPENEIHTFTVGHILDKDRNSVEAAHGGTGIHYFEVPGLENAHHGIVSIMTPSSDGVIAPNTLTNKPVQSTPPHSHEEKNQPLI